MWFGKSPHQKTINQIQCKSSDVTVRTVQCAGETVTILFVRQLTDHAALSDYVIRPLLQYGASSKKPLSARDALETVLYADDCTLKDEEEDIEQYVLQGTAVLLFSCDKQYVVVNAKQVDHRPVSEPELNFSPRSPRDAFVENLDVNLSLMRYRIKDKNLRVERLVAGARTQTRIAMLYIGTIANDTVVQEVCKRIRQIDTDGITESGEVQSFLLNSRKSLFPEMMVIERSDMAAEYLLEGKVVLLVDGSPLALAAPTAFVEFMYACDDRYENKFFGLFMRLIRFTAFFISISASSYWVAMTAFHTDILPAEFIIALAQERTSVPFSALTGVLLLEFIIELIRESLIRVPAKIGSAIGIVSVIIIGQAAISAGVFSPLLLILISVEFLASFAIPYQVAANPFRIIKILLLLITGVFGFYGYILGITAVVTEMVSINSFGVPYLAPFGPQNRYDLLRAFLFNRTVAPKRQQYMRNKDDTRTGGKG